MMMCASGWYSYAVSSHICGRDRAVKTELDTKIRLVPKEPNLFLCLVQPKLRRGAQLCEMTETEWFETVRNGEVDLIRL